MVSRGQWKFWNRRVIESVLWLGRFIWDARLVAQSCLTLCGPMDCSLPGSSVHRIFQAKILEWVAISYSRGSSQPRDQTRASHIAGRWFTFWATRETLIGKNEGSKIARKIARKTKWGNNCQIQLKFIKKYNNQDCVCDTGMHRAMDQKKEEKETCL